jgi:replicative DNA helicase
MANKSDIIGYDFSTLIDIDGQKIPCLTGLTMALSGLQEQHETVISANSGVGKSVIALQMMTALSVCPPKGSQIPCLWIPLEMNENELTMRMISLLTGIDNNKIQRANFTKEEYLRYEKAMDMVATSQFYIKKPESGTIDEIFSIFDEFSFKYGIKIGCLDYLQLIAPGQADKGFSREEMFGRASKVMKRQVAENMHMCALTIAQLNRTDFKAGEVRRQENMGGSYQVSQDADDIITLTEKTDQQLIDEKGMQGNRKAFIDKRRGGASDILINYELDDGKNQAKGRTLRCVEVINPGQMMGFKQ